MKKPSGVGAGAAENVVLLTISPAEEDHTVLKRILSRPESVASAEPRWTICPAVALQPALRVLRENPIAIILSERDLLPAHGKTCWRKR